MCLSLRVPELQELLSELASAIEVKPITIRVMSMMMKKDNFRLWTIMGNCY